MSASPEPTSPPFRNPEVARLLQRLRPRLHRILQRYQIPAADAEDLLHDAVIPLLRNWETIRRPDAWLVRTVANRCLMYWRSRRGTPGRILTCVDDSTLELLAGTAPAPQAGLPERLALRRLAARLPRYHLILLLAHSIGHSYVELARYSPHVPGTIRKIVHETRRLLREELARQVRPIGEADPSAPAPSSEPSSSSK